MKNLINKDVRIDLGTKSVSETVKGRVLEVSENWLKLETKSTIEYINLREVKRIIEKKY